MKVFPVHPLNGADQFRDNPWIKHESVRRMVDEIGGHPRGLRQLRDLLEQRYPIATTSPPRFEDLLQSLSKQFVHLASVTTSPQLMSSCLLGRDEYLFRQPSLAIAHTNAYYMAKVCIFM